MLQQNYCWLNFFTFLFLLLLSQNAEMLFNFGDTPFKHPPPSDYTAISKAAADLVPFSAQTTPTAVAASGGGKKSSRHLPMALILEPARELAQQTHDNITLFKKHLPPPKVRLVREVWDPLPVGGINWHTPYQLVTHMHSKLIEIST